MLLFIVLSALAPFSAVAWPSGAPTEACEDMMPRHDNNRAQHKASSPYTFTQSTDTYTAGDQVIVYIRAPTEHPFRGMLVQAYDPRTNKTVGEFLEGEGLKKLPECSSITHNNKREKKSATLVWVAPQSSGSVKFRATILKQFNTFYHGLTSKTQASR